MILFAKELLVAIPTHVTLNSHLIPLELAPTLPANADELRREASTAAEKVTTARAAAVARRRELAALTTDSAG